MNIANIGSQKLFQNLSRARANARKNGPETALLPMVSGRKFENADIAMSARDLVQRLCFERFSGAIYFQAQDERGDLLGVALVEGDCLTAALFSAGASQWFGDTAWELLCALKTLPECLMVEVETPFLQAYSALLNSDLAVVTSDARRWEAAAAEFATQRSTGAFRVNFDGQSLLQFFHKGQSLGLYAVEESGNLRKQGESFADTPLLPRRAKLEIWTRQEQTLFQSPSPFDAGESLALAQFLGTVYELGSNLMPLQMARERWMQTATEMADQHLWMSDLALARTLDLPTQRRLLAMRTVLRDARETRAQIVCDVDELADRFLTPIAKSVGEALFEQNVGKAFSAPHRAALVALGLDSRWLAREIPESEDGAPTSRVFDVIVGARNTHSPRRTRAKNSTFDF